MYSSPTKIDSKAVRQVTFIYHPRAFLVAQLVKTPCNAGDLSFDSWVSRWRRDRIPTPAFLGFPGGSGSKESACNVGDLGLMPGLERSHGGEHGNRLQYSCLENPPGERSLSDYSPWGRTELDSAEWLSTAQSIQPQAKEKRVVVGDFKEAEDSSQEDEKSKCLLHTCLYGTQISLSDIWKYLWE